MLALAVAAGFTVDPVTRIPLALMLALAVAVDCVAAIHPPTGACHVIVAPLVARGAAEHGLADPGADARAARPCGSTGTFLAIR